MTINSIDLLIGESIGDCENHQKQNRTREMAIVITHLETARLWLSKLK